MKISEAWLREFMSLPLSHEQLLTQLPLRGHELEGAEATQPEFSQVIIGEVVSCERHPNADKLSVCQVNVGQDNLLNIVCGAPNVGANIRVAVAVVGAVLPGDFKIKKAKLRGVPSEGMICSQRELGLGESHDGIWHLPKDAPIGETLINYLDLANDYILDIGLTANRGDCLSAEGMAREIAALNGVAFTEVTVEPTAITTDNCLSVSVQAPADCPRYVGRVIADVDLTKSSPVWLQERLRRSNIRSISLIVDIANYVMLELGQPMHAFDLTKISQGIIVRQAKAGENCVLLDGQTISLQAGDLVIADQDKVLALAGIMGGEESAVTDSTQSIFIESAFFDQALISGRARRYGLHTDSSHRFERGVDPQLAARALERATGLILDLAGGKAGPITDVVNQDNLPRCVPINLRQAAVDRLLGVELPKHDIEKHLQDLQMQVVATTDGWQVIPPSYRFDIEQEVDLIEEVIRLYGFEKLPSHLPQAKLQAAVPMAEQVSKQRLCASLLARGYQEVVTYSFVAQGLQQLLFPDCQPYSLQNAISPELGTMRVSLWPSLLQTAQYNANRQHSRLRLFEFGRSYELGGDEGIKETPLLSGLVMGPILSPQWASSKRTIDFYDVKQDIDVLLGLGGQLSNAIEYRPTQAFTCLHPGQAASIYHNDTCLGHLGCLHPELAQQLDLPAAVFLFELQLEALCQAQLPQYQPISKFPSMQRDLAIVVDEAVASAGVCELIRQKTAHWLQELVIFDVYRGSNIAKGQKSFALGLTLQSQTRTLTVQEVNNLMDEVIAELYAQFGAVLRS